MGRRHSNGSMTYYRSTLFPTSPSLDSYEIRKAEGGVQVVLDVHYLRVIALEGEVSTTVCMGIQN